MRRRAMAAWGVFALGLALGVAGRDLPGGRAWNLLAGVCLAAALTLAVTLLPWWSRFRPTVTPLAGLFRAPRKSERWCSRCGIPTARKGPCRLCGHTPTSFASRGK
ncbi:MAG TPA: hypothetical protein VM327_04475 [Candidatus Thermoplasmatota archaeon]|nr:hypothetical protein [Candidatus Thermoplasmatota archaeon]